MKRRQPLLFPMQGREKRQLQLRLPNWSRGRCSSKPAVTWTTREREVWWNLSFTHISTVGQVTLILACDWSQLHQCILVCVIACERAMPQYGTHSSTGQSSGTNSLSSCLSLFIFISVRCSLSFLSSPLFPPASHYFHV